MRSKTSQGPLTIVFDVGGVLAAHPDGARAVAAVLGCDPSVISEQYWAGREAFDLGASPEAYFAPIAAAAGLALDAPYEPAVAAPGPEDEAEEAELARVLAEIDADDSADSDDETETGAADLDLATADTGDEAGTSGSDSGTVLDAMIAADNAYWSEIHPESRLLVHELSRGKLRLAILSNAPYVFADRLREVDWTEAFEIVIVSGEEGVAKPDREIYEILFDEVKNHTGGVAVPGNMVYFDDKQENVDAALAAGIDAHFWPTNGRVAEGGTPGWEIARAALAARGVELG